MKGGGSAVWSLMWKYCISVRTLRYQGVCVCMQPCLAVPQRAEASGHWAGQLRWLYEVQGSPPWGSSTKGHPGALL